MAAMKSKDKVRAEALKSVKAAFMNWQTDKANVGKEFDDVAELNVIKKVVKQYEDTISQCNDGQHDDLIKETQDLLNVTMEFLPKPISESEIADAFEKVVANNPGLELIKRNMKVFIAKIREMLPAADGGMIAKIVSTKVS